MHGHFNLSTDGAGRAVSNLTGQIAKDRQAAELTADQLDELGYRKLSFEVILFHPDENEQ
jgi:hypothetical protein